MSEYLVFHFRGSILRRLFVSVVPWKEENPPEDLMQLLSEDHVSPKRSTNFSSCIHFHKITGQDRFKEIESLEKHKWIDVPEFEMPDDQAQDDLLWSEMYPNEHFPKHILVDAKVINQDIVVTPIPNKIFSLNEIEEIGAFIKKCKSVLSKTIGERRKFDDPFYKIR